MGRIIMLAKLEHNRVESESWDDHVTNQRSLPTQFQVYSIAKKNNQHLQMLELMITLFAMFSHGFFFMQQNNPLFTMIGLRGILQCKKRNSS